MKEHLFLKIHNNAWYAKTTPVEMSWAKVRPLLRKYLGNESTDFQILDSTGKSIPYQIDRLDPNDPTNDVLIFRADVPGHSSATYTIVDSKSEDPVTPEFLPVTCVPQTPEKWDFQFKNDQIEMEFHRGTTPFRYLAGSAYIVRMSDGVEVSNPYKIPILEWSKRLMQVEYASISLPWNARAELTWYFCDQDYEHVNSGSGPIRSFLTIRAPFQMSFEHPLRSGPGDIITHFKGYLYRIISLCAGKDHICEDIYAQVESYKKVLTEGNTLTLEEGNVTFPLHFALKMYAHVPGLRGCGWDFRKIHVCRNWFALGNNAFPHPGIGFASNVSVDGFSDIGDYYCRWGLSPTWHVRCVHQFMEGKNVPKVGNEYDFGHVVGHNWYDVIYTPLLGELLL